MPADPNSLFGRIALAKGWIDQAALDRCLSIQRAEAGEHTTIGEIMVREGLLTGEQVTEILATQRRMRGSQAIRGYELIAKIGSGGMSTVYKARKESLDKIVALKILSPSLARNQDYISRFFREARAAGQLNHPNIVAGFDVGESNGYYYFAMEYVAGKTLKQILAAEGKLAPERALNIAAQVAEALKHAHECGLVHRDVKPGNIIITASGVAKLADLGLAKAFRTDSSVTQEGRTIGTPDYASPEQARGELDVDIRTDIYSLGATLFHMVSGRVPFTGSTPAAIFAKHITEELPPLHVMRQEFPEPIARLIRKMMAKERDRRHANPAELIEDIQRTIRDLHAPQAGARARLVREQQRKVKLLPLAVAGVVVAALVVAGAVFLGNRNESGPDTGISPPRPGATQPVGAGGGTEDTLAAKAEKQAKAAYNRLREAVAKHPDAHAKILAVCDSFLERFGDTETAGLVRQLRDETLQRRKTEARQVVERVTAAMPELLADRRYGDAIARWEELRPDAERLGIAEKIDAETAALARKAREEFDRIRAEANEKAEKGDFDAALAACRAAAAKFGIKEIADEARELAVQIEEKQEAAEAAVRAARQQLELIKKETYGSVDEVVGEMRFQKAEARYRQLEEGAAPALRAVLRPFLAERRADLQTLAALKRKIIESINAAPDTARTIRLRKGWPVKASKCRASNTGLTITVMQGGNDAEMSARWEKIAPQTLSELAAEAAPDDRIAQSLLAYYTAQYPLARRLLNDALQQEDQADRAAALLKRYDEAAAVRRAAELGTMIERARAAIDADRLDDCLAILKEAEAGLDKAPELRGEFAATIEQLKTQATEKLAGRKIDQAVEAAERRDWGSVVKLLAEIEEQFGAAKVVRVGRRPELEDLRRRSERLLADPMMLEAIRAFIKLDDQRARMLFTRIARERKGSLAADARQFLSAYKIKVNLPDGDCSDTIASVRRDPDEWFKIMVFRSIRRKCPGSRDEADARLRLGEVFLLPQPQGIDRSMTTGALPAMPSSARPRPPARTGPKPRRRSMPFCRNSPGSSPTACTLRG